MYQSNCEAIGVCDMLGNPGGHVIRPNKHCNINGYTVDRTLAYKNNTFLMSEIRKYFRTLVPTMKILKDKTHRGNTDNGEHYGSLRTSKALL